MGDSVIGRAEKAEGIGLGYNVFKGRNNPTRPGIMDRIGDLFSGAMGNKMPTFAKLADGTIVPAMARINSTLGKIATGGAQSEILTLEIDGEEVDAKEYMKAADGEIGYATEDDLMRVLADENASPELKERITKALKTQM